MQTLPMHPTYAHLASRPRPLVRYALLLVTVLGCARDAAPGNRGDAPAVAAGDTIEVALQPTDSVRRARADSLAALQRDSLERHRADSLLRAAPGYVVDSARSPEEELRRFRAGTPEVTALEGGAPSRDSLVALVVALVNRHDARGIERLAVSRAEYAWLVYPSLPIARPPYRQPPDVAWMLLHAESRSGLSRLLARYRATPLTVRGAACAAHERHGALDAWTNCRVTVEGGDGRRVEQRLFGDLVAIGGRVKLLSFANDF